MEIELLKLFSLYKELIDKEAYNEIIYYYNHDEYEMALEGFLIEMISTNVTIEDISRVKIIKVAKYYKLNIESVFDITIWDKFMNWINNT